MEYGGPWHPSRPQIFKNNFSVFFLVKIQIFNSLASKKKKKKKKRISPLKCFYFIFIFLWNFKKKLQNYLSLKKNKRLQIDYVNNIKIPLKFNIFCENNTWLFFSISTTSIFKAFGQKKKNSFTNLKQNTYFL